jgi:transcriptional regulator with XRE-family HTH domain
MSIPLGINFLLIVKKYLYRYIPKEGGRRMVNLGTRLAIVRRARGIRQKEVAAQVGITQKHLSQLETGKVSLLNLRAGVLVKLADVLQVSTDYLLGRTDEDGIEVRTVLTAVA